MHENIEFYEEKRPNGHFRVLCKIGDQKARKNRDIHDAKSFVKMVLRIIYELFTNYMLRMRILPIEIAR